MRSSLIILFLVAPLLGVVALGTATWQLFINTDHDETTSYGPQGYELVCCETCPADYCEQAGWGPRVWHADLPGCLECYSGGVMVAQYGRTCDLLFCTADLDGDGDVDLADYAAMRTEWTGPE